MIKRLKGKFILFSTLCLLILMTATVLTMNLINYSGILREADEMLVYLVENKGRFPDGDASSDNGPSDDEGGPPDDDRQEGGQYDDNDGDDPPYKPSKKPSDKPPLPSDFNEETPYTTRYFAVILNSEGEIVYTDTKNTVSVDSDSAKEYALSVLESGSDKGITNRFRYMICHEDDHTDVVFLDISARLSSFYKFLSISIVISVAGLMLMFLFSVIFSSMAVKPIARAHEEQKRFTMDAGHDMKTPLTVINANLDILKDDPTDKDSLEDIRNMTGKLTSLTNDLIYLSKTEEGKSRFILTETPLSETVDAASGPFAILLERQGVAFYRDIAPSVSVMGDPWAIERLVAVLMDNAVKYTSPGGEVRLTLSKQNKRVILEVANTADVMPDKKDMPHLFDRFYRSDSSRNSQSGGHGIGLSIAKAIVTAHNGSISAADKGGVFSVTALFPAIR